MFAIIVIALSYDSFNLKFINCFDFVTSVYDVILGGFL